MRSDSRRSGLRLWTLATLLAFAGPARGRIPLAIRGTATVLLRPDSETLKVVIEKRDLNIYDGEDVLDVMLLAPDRTVAASFTIPDDGSARKSGMAPEVQTRELTAEVTKPGLYRLRITPRSGDQVFGFSLNCRKYVIEGPMFLNDSSLSGDIHFIPPRDEFTISAEAVHNPGLQKVPLYDAEGQLLHTFDLAEVVKPVVFTVGDEVQRSGKPWRLHIERQDVRFKIEGVTCWSPAPDTFLDTAKTKWLLTPYVAAACLLPGDAGEFAFSLRNSSSGKAAMTASVASSGTVRCRIMSPALPVSLEPGQSVELVAAVEVDAGAEPGGGVDCTVRAGYVEDPAASGSALLRVRIGESPVSRPLDMPIVLRPYEHEAAQFGYNPAYPPNAAFFDLDNRPYLRTRTGDMNISTGIHVLADGKWVEKSFIPALKARYPDFVSTRRAGGWIGTKSAFDADNHLYTVLTIGLASKQSRNVLLHSPDGGDTFSVIELPLGKGVADIEHWTGHNTFAGPPPVLLYCFTKPHPARFCSFHDLKILFPRKAEDGSVALGEPVLVSDRCFGSCQHSGGPAPSVTIGDRTHIVWGEVDDSGVPGVPTYAATYFHAEGKLGPKVFLAHAPPVNDVHNAPGICADSEGFLHVVTGAHGEPFKYLRSLKPNDVGAGWTKPEEACKTGFVDDKTPSPGRGRQTYLSLVCDDKDTLHTAFRQWRMRTDPYHEGGIYAALSYQRKPKGQPWDRARPLVVPPLPQYSIYYHKLTLDRAGRLCLSYSYYSIDEAYRNEIPGHYDYRALITSGDGGDSWKLAETADFANGLRQAE